MPLTEACLKNGPKPMELPQQVSLRCRIVLAAIRGESNLSIARRLDINRLTVALWRGRAKNEGIGSLWYIASGAGANQCMTSRSEIGLSPKP